VAEAAHAEANIIFGAVIDDALGDEVRVTVIAAGFDGGTPRRAVPTPARRTEPVATPPAPVGRTDATGTTFERSSERPDGDRVPEPAMAGAHRSGHAESADHDRASDRSIELGREPVRSRTIVFDDNDDLDVPEFLR
jgi:cell division protein FtsZ